MAVMSTRELMGAINPLVRATSAPVTSVNKLAIAPPPTKDDLLGPGNTVPLPASPAPTATTSIVKAAITTAVKPPPGMFDFGPGGPSPSPSPVPPSPVPVPAPGGTGVGVGGGYDVERPGREDPDGPAPIPWDGGGGGGGGGFFQNASTSEGPAAAGSSAGVPTWAIVGGGLAALALGGFAIWKWGRR